MSNSEAQERASLRPARKPWWRSRKAHAAHGGGGRVLLGGLGLSYRDPSSGAPLLDGVDVAFRARRITAVLDPSGLRSRALFLVLAGLEDPDSGRVVSAKPRSARQRWAGRIGAVALLGARDTLDRDLTIRQNILAPLAATGSVADWDNLVGALELTGLRTKVDARPAELTPLERFKATVARAIVSGAEAFLVTEPPVLPAHDIEELVGLLRAVADAGCAVVVATRHPETALRAHRVIMLANGTVSLDAAPPTLDAIDASLERSPEDPKNLLGPIPSASPLFYEAGAAGADDDLTARRGGPGLRRVALPQRGGSGGSGAAVECGHLRRDRRNGHVHGRHPRHHRHRGGHRRRRLDRAGQEDPLRPARLHRPRGLRPPPALTRRAPPRASRPLRP